jgi:hypothetical protein
VTVLPASLLMGALWEVSGPRTAFLVSAALGATAALGLLFIRTGAVESASIAADDTDRADGRRLDPRPSARSA